MAQNARAGLLYALAGFCILSVGDAIVKSMAGEWPATAIAAIRYLVGTLVLAALLVRQSGMRSLALPRDGLQWVRGLASGTSAIGMFVAVWLMPLAEATTLLFTQPMITAVLAAVILGEKAGRHTWIATGAALIGVIIVLRPNFESAGLGALLPLLGATGMSVLLIVNRKVQGTAGVLEMQYYMSVTAMIVLLVATCVGHASGVDSFALDWPHWSVMARCIVLGCSATVGQWLLFMGTTRAGAGTIAPMTYGQLLMAVVLGWYFFGSAPDIWVILGATIIIGAGLYLWRASRQPGTVSV